jgi:cytochrome P450
LAHIAPKVHLHKTAASILNFLYTLVLFPEVQQKIQDEIDERVGMGQAPSMTEMEEMSYLNTAWKESMRLNPPVSICKFAANSDTTVH